MISKCANMKTLLIVISSLATLCSCSIRLPSTWKLCDRRDDHFNQCLTKSVENAIKHLNKPLKKFGIPSLEPLHLENIFVEAGTGAVGFHQNLTYLDIYGFTKLQLRKFDIDFDTNIVLMECFFPEMKYEIEFTFNGTVVGFPINGSGLGRAIMENVRYVVTFLLDDYVKNGNVHFKVVNGKVALDTKGLKVRLERLFGDDKELEDTVNKIFNDNWEIILEQGKGSYELILGKAFSAIFNNVLSRVPIKNLFGSE